MESPSPVRFKEKKNETSGESLSEDEVASQISNFNCDFKKSSISRRITILLYNFL